MHGRDNMVDWRAKTGAGGTSLPQSMVLIIRTARFCNFCSLPSEPLPHLSQTALKYSHCIESEKYLLEASLTIIRLSDWMN